MKIRRRWNPMTFEPIIEITNGRRTIEYTGERSNEDQRTGKVRPWLVKLFKRRLLESKSMAEYSAPGWH
jgi:hypothetical protein